MTSTKTAAEIIWDEVQAAYLAARKAAKRIDAAWAVPEGTRDAANELEQAANRLFDIVWAAKDGKRGRKT